MPFLLALVSLKLGVVLRSGSIHGGAAPLVLPLWFRGHSTLITSAPKAPNQRVAQGPALTQVKSTTLMPANALGVAAICSCVWAISSSLRSNRELIIRMVFWAV